jgi:hypothetical protein
VVAGPVGTSGGGSAISGAYSEGSRRVPTVSALGRALVRGQVRVRLKEGS